MDYDLLETAQRFTELADICWDKAMENKEERAIPLQYCTIFSLCYFQGLRDR
jgi:hypothetical protein